MEWNNFTFIDLFAGIGGIRLGFESVGGICVFSWNSRGYSNKLIPKNWT